MNNLEKHAAKLKQFADKYFGGDVLAAAAFKESERVEKQTNDSWKKQGQSNSGRFLPVPNKAPKLYTQAQLDQAFIDGHNLTRSAFFTPSEQLEKYKKQKGILG